MCYDLLRFFPCSYDLFFLILLTPALASSDTALIIIGTFTSGIAIGTFTSGVSCVCGVLIFKTLVIGTFPLGRLDRVIQFAPGKSVDVGHLLVPSHQTPSFRPQGILRPRLLGPKESCQPSIGTFPFAIRIQVGLSYAVFALVHGGISLPTQITPWFAFDS